MSSSKNECTLEGVWGCVPKRTRASKGGEEGGQNLEILSERPF